MTSRYQADPDRGAHLEPGDYPPERGEVRAPVAPIRIAVGAPDPLGLGVGEHDAPGGEAPCSCGAWHREAVAEPAPVPLAALTGCDSHSVTPRASCAECNAIAEREEPSFRTGCAEHLRIWGRGCETCDRLRAGDEPAPREAVARDERRRAGRRHEGASARQRHSRCAPQARAP
jgi:hypothetical protein